MVKYIHKQHHKWKPFDGYCPYISLQFHRYKQAELLTWEEVEGRLEVERMVEGGCNGGCNACEDMGGGTSSDPQVALSTKGTAQIKLRGMTSEARYSQ